MHRLTHQPSRTPGRLTVLAIAIASVLAAGQASAETVGIINNSSIPLLDNPANTLISGTVTGIYNASGIGTLSNSGTIIGNVVGIDNESAIGTLSNSGNINGNGAFGIYNGGTIDTLDNTTGGSIYAGNDGIGNSGVIGTLNNSDDITGGAHGIINYTTITSLNNFTGGAINGVSGEGINNLGSIGTLSNSGTISGMSGAINEGSIDTLDNSGTLSGNFAGIRNIGTITALNNDAGGDIHSNYSGGSNTGVVGINNSGTIGTLTNNGTISGNSAGIHNYPDGTIGALSNSGTISGNNNGIYNDGANIGTLSNSGTVSSQGTGIYNYDGTIDALSNSGTIGSSNIGINNDGATIGTLSNSGTISSQGTGIANSGTITSLTNDAGGTISGAFAGISNKYGGTIDTLSNSGTISGRTGIDNYRASIDTLNNSGTISSEGTGIDNYFGSIGTLNNSGNISTQTGIYNGRGSISTLNNSGIITGQECALYNGSSGTLGTITNSGTIAGTIQNNSDIQTLTIDGGTGPVFGVLTGAGAGGVSASNIGQINNYNSDVVFGSGNQLLNDHIDVSGDSTHTVSNLAATLQVNNTININGNYSQGANASLILGVADNAVTTGNINTDAGYGRLVVSGSANIASGSTVALKKLGSYDFAQGQRYVVVQANATGTNYNADTLHYTAAGLDATGTSVIDGSQANLLVTLGSDDSSAPINQATSANGTTSLAGLFNYDGFDAGLMNLFNAAAALDSSAAGDRAGAQLSPTATQTAATQASTASTVQVLNVTAAHLDGLRTAQNDSVGSGVATGESANSTGLWGQAFGGSSRLGERDDIAGYHAHYSGLLLGADAALNDSWRAGGLFSYTKTSVNNDGDNSGSSADVKSYGLFGYASYIGQPWYVDLSLGAVQHQYDTRREIDFSGFNGTAKGDHNGMQYIASAQTGYPIDLGSAMAHTILTPIAGLTYSTLRQDSYTETGGNGAALHVDSNNTGSLKSDLGTKLERSFATSYGSVVPSAQLTWRHEYRDTSVQSVSNFAADSSGATSFTSPGAKPIDDTGVLALGVTLLHSESLSLSAKYTLEAASGYSANTGDVQVRWEF